jgi:glycosyltransferase involved in cell wall biosynthesis
LSGATLRVLHCPDVVGGHAPELARAERALGLQSRSVALQASAYGYAVDETLTGPDAGRIAREMARWRLLVRALRDFDVVHFNFGSTIFAPRGFDLPLIARAGKRIFVTYQGDDARQGDYCRAHFPVHFAHDVAPGYYTPQSDARKRRSIAAMGARASGVYALNPDLLHVLPRGASFLPYANVDPSEWRPSPKAPGGTLKIVHAPSHRGVKGTRYLVEAVERLKREGRSLELVLVENLRRDEARRIYENADLVVDQLLAGWYGGLAVEAMALGKPVVSYLREADLGFIPQPMREEMPIVRAEPGTIYDVLRALDPAMLPQLGRRARAYVERWHDPRKVAARTIEDYRRACR